MKRSFYTSGRTSNEAAFAYQLFVREFGTNNLPDCSNMCHESSGSALSETIGIGKGSVLLEDLDKAELIIIAGQNPGTNHPRMLTALEKAKENGARIVAVNPLPEAGLLRFKNPQRPKGVVGRGTQLADLFLQIKVNGDLALFQALNLLLLEAEDAEPGDVLDHRFIAEHTDGFDEFAAATRKLNWDERHRRDRAAPRPDRRTRRTRHSLAQHRGVLGDGPDTTQELGPHHSRDRELPPAARKHWSAGRRRLPGARSQQCAGRPHHGHLGERRSPSSSTRSSTSSASSRLVRTASTRSRRSARCATAESRSLSRWAATSQPRRQTRRRHSPRSRTCGSVSTSRRNSIARTPWSATSLSSCRHLGAPSTTCKPAGEQFVTVEDSMGMVHASSGVLAPASRYLLSEVAIVTPAGSRRARRREPGAVGRIRSRLRPHSRVDRTGSARLRRFQRTCSGARRVHVATSAARFAHVHDAKWPGRVHRERAGRTAARPWLPDPADDSFARPVQHHDLRPQRSLPRHPSRSPRGVRQPR